MNAPAHKRIWSQAQLAEQEALQFGIYTAKLAQLFNRSGQRDEWRTDFMDAVHDFIDDQTGELNRAVEFDGDESDRETQRTWFNATRGLAA